MTQSEPRWVPRLVVEATHHDQIHEHGGAVGLRDENALEAALARPKHRWHYEPNADLAGLAAAYTYGICAGHPFLDGNKRAAFITAVIFLGLNGLEFAAPEDDVVATMLALASGELGEDEVTHWIRANSVESGSR